MAEQDYVRLAAACHCGKPVKQSTGRGRKPQFCENHTGVKHRSGCTHEKPRFANGKERKFCFSCVPKAPAKPRKKHKSADYRMADPAVCAAPGCGHDFTRKLPHERFCSRTCQLRVQNRARQEKLRNSAPRACRWCSKVYVPEYGSLRTHYCTLECRDAAKRKVKSGSTHRRRSTKFGCKYEPISKREVFERDGWRCYLCGCDTPKHLSGTTDPNAPELEHVVPLAKGGSHTWDNVRCACRRCNRAKGVSLPARPDRTSQDQRGSHAPRMVEAPAIDEPGPA